MLWIWDSAGTPGSVDVFQQGMGLREASRVAHRLSLYHVSGSLYSFCPPNNPQEGMLFPFYRETLRSSDIIRITGLKELGFDSRSSRLQPQWSLPRWPFTVLWDRQTRMLGGAPVVGKAAALVERTLAWEPEGPPSFKPRIFISPFPHVARLASGTVNSQLPQGRNLSQRGPLPCPKSLT